MKKTITTTKTNDEWEQTMVCEFANATIAELVWQDTGTHQYRGEWFISNDPNANLAAKIKREGSKITVQCFTPQMYWKADPDANQDVLELLAQDWNEQEQAWLPISRYLSVSVKPALKRTLKLTSSLIDEIAKLERRLIGFNNRDVDILDCLGMDFNAIERLSKELSLHREQRFHFWGGKK